MMEKKKMKEMEHVRLARLSVFVVYAKISNPIQSAGKCGKCETLWGMKLE